MGDLFLRHLSIRPKICAPAPPSPAEDELEVLLRDLAIPIEVEDIEGGAARGL